MVETTDAAGGQLVPVAQGRLERGRLVRGRDERGRDERGRDERGMVSAEWAVGIIAAIAIAGVLLSVVTSGPVEAAILKFILLVIRHFAVGLG